MEEHEKILIKTAGQAVFLRNGGGKGKVCGWMVITGQIIDERLAPEEMDEPGKRRTPQQKLRGSSLQNQLLHEA